MARRNRANHSIGPIGMTLVDSFRRSLCRHMDYNPYAAPQGQAALATPYGSPFPNVWLGELNPKRGEVWTWCAIGAFGVMALTAVAVIVGVALDSPELAGIAAVVGYLAFMARQIFGVCWLYSAWAALPEDLRYVGRRYHTPGAAVGYLFIPFYNLYWMFVVNGDLCSAINRAAAYYGTKRAPHGLAVAACVLSIVPYCNLLIAPILWTVFMFIMDRAKRDLLTAMVYHQQNQAAR